MKKIKYVFFAGLFICTLFAVTPALAQGPGTPCSSTDPDAACGGGSDGSSLPINAHVWFLIAAAGVIGAKVIVSKSKAAKAQKPAVELQR